VPLLNNDGRDPNNLLAFDSVTINFYSATNVPTTIGKIAVNLVPPRKCSTVFEGELVE
jgi:hypothetical protein